MSKTSAGVTAGRLRDGVDNWGTSGIFISMLDYITWGSLGSMCKFGQFRDERVGLT